MSAVSLSVITFGTGGPTTIFPLRTTATVARFAGFTMGLVGRFGVRTFGTALTGSASGTGKGGGALFATTVTRLRFFGVVSTWLAWFARTDSDFTVHSLLQHGSNVADF